MLRVIIGLVFLIVMLLFVASNSDPIQLNIIGQPLYRALPTSLVLVVFAAFSFLVGAVLVWFSELKQRRRARRAEAQIRTLEAQLAEAAQRYAAAAAPAYAAGIHTPGTVPAATGGVAPAALPRV